MIDGYISRDKNWFYKYKLYHVPFWLFYNYIWWTVAVGNPVKAAQTILFTPFAIKFGFYYIFQMLAVYLNLYYLIPHFLQKNKIVTYIGWLTVCILATSLLVIPGYYLSAYASHQSMVQFYGDKDYCWFKFFGNALPSTLACMTLAMSIKLTKNWISTEKRQQLLEKEKLETELKFLKYQFNPHFLFNSINSIFFLIHKNPDKASASLAKFSDLLRHQLYECNDPQIPLNKEILYLENFIELEKLRQNKNVDVQLLIENSSTPEACIAPFILMTFIENAFKHVSRNSGSANWINIQIVVKEDVLHLFIANSISGDHSSELLHIGGIGLKNAKRRLDLIYPEKHQLFIQDKLGAFEVNLMLQLSKLELTESQALAI